MESLNEPVNKLGGRMIEATSRVFRPEHEDRRQSLAPGGSGEANQATAGRTVGIMGLLTNPIIRISWILICLPLSML